MADRTPAEDDLQRDGPQLTAAEARARAARHGTVRGPAGQGDADRDVPLNMDAGMADTLAPADSREADWSRSRESRPAPDGHPYVDSETALGGADSIQKTTWGVGHGGEPDGLESFAPIGLRKGQGPVVSRVATGGGFNPVMWAVAIVAALALIAYVIGVFAR